MPVRQVDGRVILTHANGSSAKVLFYGATVVSWKAGTQSDPEPVERLFVSSKAALDGTRPVRGGIPIVFPCFGAPRLAEHARLAQHGFARSATWTFDGVVMDDENEVSVRLTLEPTAGIKAVYDRPFALGYEVKLGGHTLSTDLDVTNTSVEDELAFQAVFHNYIRASAEDVLVFPLQKKRYYDKTERSEEGRNTAKTEERSGVDVKTYTDSVYEDGSGKYSVRWTGGGMEVKAEGLKDVVVWNPGREVGSKMADMEEDGWARFVCVEPGHALRGYALLSPGQSWFGRQVLLV